MHNDTAVRRQPVSLSFMVAVAPYLLLTGWFWTVVDDAFISFRYARNLSMGNGLRYNLGEQVPVEGFSNFLWVIISAVFEFFRMDITVWPPVLSVVCGVCLLWLVFDCLHRRLEVGLPVACLATLGLGCFPPFAYWSTGGLATMPFALLIFITFERLILRRGGIAGISAGLAGLALALIRVEGIAWVGVLLVLAIVSRRLAGQRCLYPLLKCILIIAIGYAVYFVGRYSYYQQLWPNTVYAKMGLTTELLCRGLCYVAIFVMTFLPTLLIIPGTFFAMRRQRLAIGLPIVAMAWAFFAYAIVVTGDYMAMGRFLIPSLPFVALLLGWMLHDLWGVGLPRRTALTCITGALVVIGLLPGWNTHVVPTSVRARFHFRHNTKEYRSEYEQMRKEAERVTEWTTLGRALKYYADTNLTGVPNPSYVVEAIGAVGYYSDLYIHDRNALVSPAATQAEPPPGRLKSPGHDRTVEAEFFLDEQPTIYFARIVSPDDPRTFSRICNRAVRTVRPITDDNRLSDFYKPDIVALPVSITGTNNQYLVTVVREENTLERVSAMAEFQQAVRQIKASD